MVLVFLVSLRGVALENVRASYYQLLSVVLLVIGVSLCIVCVG